MWRGSGELCRGEVVSYVEGSVQLCMKEVVSCKGEKSVMEGEW